MTARFPTRVAGIPCQIEVLQYEPYRSNRWGHIDNWLPDDEEYLEFGILDRRGRPAEWLERKLTDADRMRIYEEADQFMAKAKFDFY